jgi:transcriptional regulator GlxA family with amidase domain
MDPVSTKNKMFATLNSTTNFAVLPTHTFETAPPLDVLLIPGGLGERAPVEELQGAIDYVTKVTPDLQYLLTVCTGAGIAARAGVLDGKYATTNKQAWAGTIVKGQKTKWVAKARWVVDGKIWTSSGVQAGMDLMHAFVTKVWGSEFAESSTSGMEYTPNVDARADPWAVYHGLSSEYDGLLQADGTIKV